MNGDEPAFRSHVKRIEAAAAFTATWGEMAPAKGTEVLVKKGRQFCATLLTSFTYDMVREMFATRKATL
jgi:hypothetical protein